MTAAKYQDIRGDDWVGHHERAFLGVQPAALPQNAVGEVDLAEVLEQCRVPHPSSAGRVEPEMLRQSFRQRGVLVGATSQRLAQLDGAGQGQHHGFFHFPRFLEEARRFDRRGRLIGERHHGRQVRLTQPGTDHGDRADCLVTHHQWCGNHGGHLQQLAQPPGVRGRLGLEDHRDSPDQLVVVADVLRFEGGAGPVEDRHALEGDEGANLFATCEPCHLGGRMQRVDVRDRQPATIGRSIEKVGGQPRVRQAGCDRRENGGAIEVLQCLEPGLAQGFQQGRHRRLAGQDGVTVAGHLRQELTEAGFGQPLRTKEPNPADLFAG